MKTHKDLDVWKKAIAYVTEIYTVTKGFPKDEVYGLTNQMRRAAVSIPSNVAEGAARHSDKEFIHFLYISLGSLQELDTQLTIANNLNFISLDIFTILQNQLNEIGKMLNGLINYKKSKL